MQSSKAKRPTFILRPALRKATILTSILDTLKAEAANDK